MRPLTLIGFFAQVVAQDSSKSIIAMEKLYRSWNTVAEKSWKKSSEQEWFHTHILYPGISNLIVNRTNILDYGCGSGELIKELIKFGHNVYGFDPSIEMVKLSQQLNPGILIVNKIDLLGNTKFNITILNMVLSCVQDVYSVIKTIFSFSNRIIVTLPHPIFSLFSDLHTTTRRVWMCNNIPDDEQELYLLEPMQKVIWDNEGTSTFLFYRTLNTWFNIFKKCNLIVEHLEELFPKESGQCIPKLYEKFSKIPPFILFDLSRKQYRCDQ